MYKNTKKGNSSIVVIIKNSTKTYRGVSFLMVGVAMGIVIMGTGFRNRQSVSQAAKRKQVILLVSSSLD